MPRYEVLHTLPGWDWVARHRGLIEGLQKAPGIRLSSTEPWPFGRVQSTRRLVGLGSVAMVREAGSARVGVNAAIWPSPAA
jgi:hypothetical protein